MDGDAKHVWIQPGRHTNTAPNNRKRLLTALIATFVLLLTLPAFSEGRNAYVANKASNDVSILGTEGRLVFDTIGMQESPTAITITPDGSHSYVANRYEGTVSVVDVDTNLKVDEIPVGVSPLGIVITPDGSRAYVTNMKSDTVSVIDTDTNTVLRTIDVGHYPYSVAVDPDGSRIYVANRESSTLSVIDTSTDTIEREIMMVNRPTGIAITPDGSRIYVTNFISTTVSVIDTATWDMSAVEVDPWPTMIAITPDGSRAYVTSILWWSVSVIDTDKTSPDFNTKVGNVGRATDYESPRGIAITPNGSQAYVANEGRSPDPDPEFVSVIDTASTTLEGNTIEVGNEPRDIAIVPNQGPVAKFAVSEGKVGETTSFDASDSTDSDGTVVRYDWDFGDGTRLSDGGPTPTHTYSGVGSNTATLTVTDNDGGSTEFVSDGRTAYHNGGEAAREGVTFNVTDNDVESSPEPAPTPSTGPFVTGQPSSCEKVLYENRLEVPREVELADLVTGKGLKVRASASKKSQGTLTVEITGRKARHFKLFGKNSRVKSKRLASTKVKVGSSQKNLYLLAKGKARRLIKRALRLKGAPARTKLKVSLTTHSLDNKRLKRLNAQTVRAVRRGKVKHNRTYLKFSQTVDRSQCGKPLVAKIKGPQQTDLRALTTRKGKPGDGIKVKVSCSEDCTANVGLRLWGRYEVGLKFRKPGQKKSRILSSRKVKLHAGETKTLILKGITSKKLRKLLVRGANNKRYKRIKLKYSVAARTKDGRSDSGAGTTRVRLRFN